MREELEKKRKSDLIALAKQLNIKGRSVLKKDLLIQKIIQVSTKK